MISKNVLSCWISGKLTRDFAKKHPALTCKAVELALRLNGENTDAEFNLAALQCKEGNLTEARSHLENLAGRLPNSPQVHCWLGLVCNQLGDKESALLSMQRVYALGGARGQPGDMMNLHMGLLLIEKEEHRKAQEVLSIFFQTSTFEEASYEETAIYLYDIGCAWMEKGYHSLAEECFLEAIKWDVTLANPYLHLAQLQALSGAWPMAVAYADAAEEIAGQTRNDDVLNAAAEWRRTHSHALERANCFNVAAIECCRAQVCMMQDKKQEAAGYLRSARVKAEAIQNEKAKKDIFWRIEMVGIGLGHLTSPVPPPEVVP
jgi:tetratricopeptide (TPR) repeat protein